MSGVFSSSTSFMSAWIWPICVPSPVATTTPTARPPATIVPLNSIESRSEMVFTLAALTAAVSLRWFTLLSPVSIDSSTASVTVSSSRMRQSAGTLSPCCTRTISPGTRSALSISSSQSPSRRQRAWRGCIFLSASSALSALLSCHTPTMALMMRMSRMTSGST